MNRSKLVVALLVAIVAGLGTATVAHGAPVDMGSWTWDYVNPGGTIVRIVDKSTGHARIASEHYKDLLVERQRQFGQILDVMAPDERPAPIRQAFNSGSSAYQRPIAAVQRQATKAMLLMRAGYSAPTPTIAPAATSLMTAEASAPLAVRSATTAASIGVRALPKLALRAVPVVGTGLLVIDVVNGAKHLFFGADIPEVPVESPSTADWRVAGPPPLGATTCDLPGGITEAQSRTQAKPSKADPICWGDLLTHKEFGGTNPAYPLYTGANLRPDLSSFNCATYGPTQTSANYLSVAPPGTQTGPQSMATTDGFVCEAKIAYLPLGAIGYSGPYDTPPHAPDATVTAPATAPVINDDDVVAVFNQPGAAPAADFIDDLTEPEDVPTATVPDCVLQGLSWTMCRDALQLAGFTVIDRTELSIADADLSKPAAAVLALDPPAGTETSPDTPIAVTTNPDTMPVVVPEPMAGETADDYAERVENAGLVPTINVKENPNPDVGPDAVLDVDPAPGERVMPGSTVEVLANPPDAPGTGTGAIPNRCGLPSPQASIDLSPIAELQLEQRAPFSLLPWLIDFLGGFAIEPERPNHALTAFGIPVGDLSFLAHFDGIIATFRMLVLVSLLIAAAWLIWDRTLGRL